MKLRQLFIFVLAAITFSCSQNGDSDDHSGDHSDHKLITQKLTIKKVRDDSDRIGKEPLTQVLVDEFKEDEVKKDFIYYTFLDESLTGNENKPVEYTSHIKYFTPEGAINKDSTDFSAIQIKEMEILSPFNKYMEEDHYEAMADGKLGCIGYLPHRREGDAYVPNFNAENEIELPCYAHFQTGAVQYFVGRFIKDDDDINLQTKLDSSDPRGFVSLGFENIYIRNNSLYISDLSEPDEN